MLRIQSSSFPEIHHINCKPQSAGRRLDARRPGPTFDGSSRGFPRIFLRRHIRVYTLSEAMGEHGNPPWQEIEALFYPPNAHRLATNR